MSHSEAPDPDRGAHARCVASLARALRVGPLYPPGHARLAAVTAELDEALREVAAGAERVSVELGEQRLELGGVPLSLDGADARSVHESLGRLGLARIELEPGLSPDDLHRLGGELSRAQRSDAGPAAFQTLELSVAPGRVRLVPRSFGRRGAPAAPEDERPPDPAPEEESSGRALRHPSPATLAEAGSAPAAPVQGRAEERPLDEVLDAGTGALKRALESFLDGALSPEEISGLLRLAENAAALSDDADAAAEAFDLIQDAGLVEPTVAEVRGPADATMAEEELAARLAEHARGVRPLASLEATDRAETLSILLQLLTRAPACGTRPGFAAALRGCLTGPLTQREGRVLSIGFAELCTQPAEVLDRAFPPLVSVLRDALGGRYHRALNEVLHAAGQDALEALWPHAVNELLLASASAAPEAARSMLARIGTVGPAAVRTGLTRLAGLEALAEGAFDARLRADLPPELGVVLGELALHPAGVRLAPALAELVRARATRWSGSIAFERLDLSGTSDQALLAQELRALAGAAHGDERRDAAGRVLLERLRGLPTARHEERWVLPAIEALGELEHVPALGFLWSVARERKSLLLAAWPAACRRAARRAAERLQNRAAHRRGLGREPRPGAGSRP